VTETMKPWKKIAIGAGVVVLLAIIVGVTVHQSGKNVVTVQTGKVQRQDLSSVVSASGEIKPKTYVNIGANAYGKITHLYVKEGDHVKKGQLLAQLENVQSTADVSANQRLGAGCGNGRHRRRRGPQHVRRRPECAPKPTTRATSWTGSARKISYKDGSDREVKILTVARTRGPQRTPGWCKPKPACRPGQGAEGLCGPACRAGAG
jgi:hypothetical protein